MCMSPLILSNHTTLDLVFTWLSKNLIQLSVSAVWLHYILKKDQGCWNDMKKLSKYCHHHHTKFETYKILHWSFTKYSSPLTKARQFEFCTPMAVEGDALPVSPVIFFPINESKAVWILYPHGCGRGCFTSVTSLPSQMTIDCFTRVTSLHHQ